VAERIGARTVSLPLASLAEDDVRLVVGAVRRVVAVPARAA
jgi:dTDP-4-amino-4,6-dideoxygalactose transaminase